MKKIILSVVAITIVAAAAAFAYNKATESEDCKEGSACCYPGSPCCKK